MDADEALRIVEHLLSDQRLGRLQAIVFRQTWEDLSYQAIAKQSGYEVGYIKQTGSQLWQLLSSALGERVSKNNLHVVLKRYVSQLTVNSEQLTGGSRESGIGSWESGVGSGESEAGSGESGVGSGGSESTQNSKLSSEAAQSATQNSPPSPLPPPHLDWGEASDVSVFYGRSAELATLEHWVLDDRCRLVGLFGMGGIGKTALSVRLAKQIQDKFEFVIWRSLRNAPPIHSLLNDLMQFVADQPTQALLSDADTLDKQMRRLLHYLRVHRCLLILDNAETIMQPGDRDGSYQPGYEGYGQLLRCVGETLHQSCLLITSREKPKGLAPKEGASLPVRSLQLTGLTPAIGRELFSVKGTFSGSAAEWQRLVDHYAGNPLALKIVATAIADFFDGSLTQFLDFSQQGSSVFGDIRDLLARQIGRLSELEQQVMFWLAINREPIRFAELQSDCLPPATPAQLLETLTALERRSLIEKNGNLFTLQPVVMEYMTERLIEGVCVEIGGWGLGVGSGEWGVGSGEWGVGSQSSKLKPQNSELRTQTSELKPQNSPLFPTPLLRSHALIKAQAKDYVRETQIRLLLGPIVDRLLHTRSRADLDRSLMQLLEPLRGQAPQTIGYVGGNVINLLCQLQQLPADAVVGDRIVGDRTAGNRTVDTLRDRDFSHLTLWQAYLQTVNLHGTDFSYSDLSKAVFTETFSQILAVAVSPDGKLLAASDISYEVHLWRVADGKKLLTCKAQDGWAWSVAFSPDNRLLASSANGTIHLWDVQTGDCVRTFKGYTSRVFSLAFDPTGSYLASGNEDTQVRIWTVATGALTAVLADHTDEVHSVAFSPDGRMLASGSYDRTIKLWDVSGLGSRESGVGSRESGVKAQNSKLSSEAAQRATQNSKLKTLPHTLTGHSDWIWSIAFSPDGTTLASSSSDRTIKLWEMQTQACVKTLTGHAEAVRSIAFAASTGNGVNGACLISGSDDRTVRLWNDNGDCLRVLQGHTSWISAVAFSPDGCLLASGSEDQSVRLWDSRTNQCLRLLQGYNSGVWSIAFSPDGQTLVSGGQDRAIRLWHLSEGGGGEWGVGSRESGVGSRESGVGSGETIEREERLITNHQKLTTLSTLHGHTSWIWSVAFSPDGHLIASGSEDGTVRLWDVPELGSRESGVGSGESGVGSGEWGVGSRESGVGSGEWGVGSRESGVGSRESKLKTQNSKLKTLPLPLIPHPSPLILTGHTHAVWSVAFSPDGQLLASGSLDSTIRLWHRSGAAYQCLEGHESGVCAVAFAPRSPLADQPHLLASGSQDQTIRLWAIAHVAPLNEISNPSSVTVQPLNTLHGHTSWIRCLAFSPDGTRLASGSSDGIIILWNVETGDRLHTFQGHSSLVLTVTFSPEGTVLASSGGDGIIKLWDLAGVNSEQLAVDSEQLAVDSEQLAVDSEQLAVDSEQLAVDSEQLAVDSEQLAVDSEQTEITQNSKLPLPHPPTPRPPHLLLQTLHGHQNWVRFLAYSPDGKLLASCSQDGTIKLWSEAAGVCLETLRVQRPYEGATITGVTGLTIAQKDSLKLLGAIEQSPDVQ